MVKVCGHCREGFHGLCGGSAMAPYYICPCTHPKHGRTAEVKTALTGTVGCGVCGEAIETERGDAMAEVYDPEDADESDIVHAECIPVGWKIA